MPKSTTSSARLPLGSSCANVAADATQWPGLTRPSTLEGMEQMQIGCSAPTSVPLIAPDSLVRIATEAEMLGFDYVTVSDHVMIPTSIASRYPYSESGEFPSGAAAPRLEQLTAATFIAAVTKKLRIVTSVMVVPHRPAVLTAKILASLD